MTHTPSQRKTSNSSNMNLDTQEFFLLEKLYEAMRNDKKRGKATATDREFYLMERLYEAIRNDKIRNKKISSN